MMKKRILILLAAILTLSIASAQSSLTAPQVLQKAVQKINASRGISARFKIFNSGYSGSGEIKTQGGKFTLVMPDVEVWYNGKDLFTLNKHTSETTVVVPTQEELAASNPLSYVTSASTHYSVTFSTVKKEGRYVLELTPKTAGEVKRVTITLKKTDYLPEKIVVEPVAGSPVSADITEFKTGQTFSSSEFEYPRSRYPKIEIVDLR